MEELWKPIKGYEGLYEISNLGRVRSIAREVQRGNSTIRIKEKMKKPYIAGGGYYYIMLSKNGKTKIFTLHRLLAEAFIPNPNNLPEVDHINTNKSDYRLENLRWVTHKENNNNIISLQNRRKSTYTPEVIYKGMETRKRLKCANGPRTVYQYSKEGVLLNEFYSMEEAKRKTSAGHICEVLDDCTQSSGGFLWASVPTDNFIYQEYVHPSSKAVQRLDMQNNIIGEWDSLSEAARQTGIHINAIARNIKAAHPTKYKFRYKEDV